MGAWIWGWGQEAVPRPYPRRTSRRNSGDLRRAKLTSNVPREVRRRKDHLLPGGCRQTQYQQESLGRELCRNRWPCEGMSSLPLEGPWGPPAQSPTQSRDPQVSTQTASSSDWRALGEASSFGCRDKGPRELALSTHTLQRLTEVLPQTVPKHLLAEFSGKVLLPSLSTGASQGRARGPAEQRGSNLS